MAGVINNWDKLGMGVASMVRDGVIVVGGGMSKKVGIFAEGEGNVRRDGEIEVGG